MGFISKLDAIDQRLCHITGSSRRHAATQEDGRQTLDFINWLNESAVRAARTCASCNLRSDPSTPSDSKDQWSDI